jgi:ATP-binding cassette subfamily B (MDR/TAP) protein 1
MPITLSCAFFRLRYEVQFESLNQAVFAESSKFASESINAFRTVSSLTLENMISKRYETLLNDHINTAFKKARFTTLVFAFSDSTNLLLMSLIFWYGVCIMNSASVPGLLTKVVLRVHFWPSTNTIQFNSLSSTSQL